jgi:hypothetical protein
MEFDDEFVRLCYTHYNTTIFNEKEFEEDVLRFSTIKKLISRYVKTGSLNVRMILNNIIILRNVFGIEMLNVALFYKISEEHYPLLKSLLIAIDSIVINEYTSEIALDKDFLEYILREIKK